MNNTGVLLNEQNLKFQRQYFEEMVRLIGLKVLYLAPRKDKTYNGYGELESFFYDPVEVGCIFTEHPNVWTMRKAGWNVERADDLSMIQVPYDLERLERGGLFLIKCGPDTAEPRKFQIRDMKTDAVVPVCVECLLGAVYSSTFETSQFQHTDNNFNLLRHDEEEE